MRMDRKKVRAIEKKLEKMGIEYRTTSMTDDRPVIIVKHDYDGLYPPASVHKLHHDIEKAVKRLGVIIEARGCYTATWIY